MSTGDPSLAPNATDPCASGPLPATRPPLPAGSQTRAAFQSWTYGRKSNSYGTTNASGRARVVVGNVSHHRVYNDNTIVLQGDIDKQVAINQSLMTKDLVIDAQSLAGLISDYDLLPRQQQLLFQHLAGTCEWIQGRPGYRKWCEHEGPPLLICTGSVGCGKSVTASFIFEELGMLSATRNECLVACFLDDDSYQAPTLDHLSRAIVKQLLSSCVALGIALPQSLLAAIHRVFVKSKAASSPDVLANVLGELRRSLPQHVTILIDGLDCLAEDEVSGFLRLLRLCLGEHIDEESSTRWLIFCRDTLGRGIKIDNIPHSRRLRIDLSHIECDLHRYIDHEVNSRCQESATISNQATISKITTALKENCEKMFIWIRLQIATLWDPKYVLSDEDAERQLDALPQGLDEIYLRCLNVIGNTNDGRSRDIAPRVFKWIANARVPLNMRQACEIVSITADELPLKASQVLTAPVTDFCANLIEIDRTTGHVRFPHRSVKEFLSNIEELPENLRHYGLSSEADDLWCGQICHAYAEIYHARDAMVIHRTVEVDKSYAAGVVDSVLHRSLPFRWTQFLTKNIKPSQATVSFVLPTERTERSLIGKDSSLHEYMCQFWLSHNRLLEPDKSWYPALVEICLSHDRDLLPWIKINSSHAAGDKLSINKYQRMAEFAVTNNNLCLLRIVAAHLDGSRAKLWPQILSEPFPGTDSSFLHIAVALDYTEILRALLDTPWRNLHADSTGRSALALAIELGRTKAVSMLLPSYPSFPCAMLDRFGPGDPKTEENLFRICIEHGDTAMMMSVLSRVDPGIKRYVLSDALYHAATLSNDAIGTLLHSWGANLNVLNSRYYVDLQGRTDWWKTEQRHAALVTMQHNAMGVWIFLKRLGATEFQDVFMGKSMYTAIVARFGASYSEAKPWIDLFDSLLQDAPSKRREFTYSRLETFLELVYPSGIGHARNLTPEAVSCYQRELLRSLNDLPNWTTTYLPLKERKRNEFLHWIHGVDNDVLIRVFRLRLINTDYMFSQEFLDVLIHKDSAVVVVEGLMMTLNGTYAPRYIGVELRVELRVSYLARMAEEVFQEWIDVQPSDNRRLETWCIAASLHSAMLEAFSITKARAPSFSLDFSSRTTSRNWTTHSLAEIDMGLKMLVTFARLCQYPIQARILWISRLIQDGNLFPNYFEGCPHSEYALREALERSCDIDNGFVATNKLEISTIFFLNILRAEIPSLQKAMRDR